MTSIHSLDTMNIHAAKHPGHLSSPTPPRGHFYSGHSNFGTTQPRILDHLILRHLTRIFTHQFRAAKIPNNKIQDDTHPGAQSPGWHLIGRDVHQNENWTHSSVQFRNTINVSRHNQMRWQILMTINQNSSVMKDDAE